MPEPVICATHQRRVVVGDHQVWHERDGHPCDAALLVRGSSVLTPAQIRREEVRGG